MSLRARSTGILLGAGCFLLLGCGELDGLIGENGFGETRVSGLVYGESYDFVSGTAEASGGVYTLTLSDSWSYDCRSTPSGRYLTIVVAGVTTEGTISAAGNVTFNQIEEGFGSIPEGATAGSLTIDRLDEEESGMIEGYIDARGESSEVRGSFSVPICR